MITKVSFPGIEKIEDEIDYLNKEIHLPIYAAKTRGALDVKDISGIVGKLHRVYRNEQEVGGQIVKGPLLADVDTYSKVLEDFACELIYTGGIWLAVLADEDTPVIKEDPRIRLRAQHQEPVFASNGQAYAKAAVIIPENPEQTHAFDNQSKNDIPKHEVLVEPDYKPAIEATIV